MLTYHGTCVLGQNPHFMTLRLFDKSIKKSQSALGLSTNQLFIEQQASARGKYRNICAKNHATFLINTMIAARGNN
jgi:hypothetical protein